jgi:hypothetical protein
MMEGVNSNIIYCKNFCKCHNVHLFSTKKRKRSKLLKFKNDLFFHIVFWGIRYIRRIHSYIGIAVI